MRALALVLTVVVLGSCSSPARRRVVPPPAPADPNVRLVYLDNGLAVTLYRDARAPMAHVFTRLAVGTIDDPIDQPGMASVAAALLYEGRVAPDAPTFAARLVPITLVSSGSLDETSMSWFSTALPRHVDELIGIEADRLTLSCANVDQPTFERAVHRAISDPRYREDEAAFRRIIARAVYGGVHPYARRTRPATSSVIKRERTCNFVASRMGADVARLTIAGNIDLDHTEQAVRRAFSSARVATARQSSLPDPLPPGRLEITADVERPLVVISASGPLPGNASRSLAGEVKGFRRELFLDFGTEPSHSVSLVIPVEDDRQIEAEIARGITVLRDAGAKAAAADLHSIDSFDDSIWFDGATYAVAAFDRDPTWVPGEAIELFGGPMPPEPFAAERLQVAVVRPSGRGSIQPPPHLIGSLLAFGDEELDSHPDPSSAVELPAGPIAALARRRLDNGLRIVELRQPGAPTMAAHLVFPVGDRDDAMAHDAAVNFDLEAATWDSGTVSSHATRFDKVAHVGAQKASIAELWTEHQASLGDIDQRTGGVAKSSSPAACPTSRYSVEPYLQLRRLVAPPRGNRWTLDHAAALAFRRARYRLDQASLVLVGGFTSSSADAEIARTFATWKPPSEPPAVATSPAPLDPKPAWLGIADDRARAATVALGFSTSSHPAHDLAARLVVERLSTGVRTSAFDDSTIVVRDFASSTLSGDVTALLRALDAVRTNPGDRPAELANARREALSSVLASFEGSTAAANALDLLVEYDLPDDFFDQVAREILSITPEEIAEVARKDLDPAQMAVVIYGPRAAVEAALIATGATADAIEWRDYSACP
jgi:zinc protease